MAPRSRSASAPLTFDLPVALLEKTEAARKTRGLKTASALIRLALDQFDFEACRPLRVPHRQISVRVSSRQRSALRRYARAKKVSVGELVRYALEGLPSRPAKRAKR